MLHLFQHFKVNIYLQTIAFPPRCYKCDCGILLFKYRSKKLSLFKVRYLTSDSGLVQKVENFIADWTDSGSHIETRTSGSTGTPKVIRLEKSKMRCSAEMTGAYFGFGSGQKILLCLSPDSIGGKMLIVRAIIHEMELVVSNLGRNPMEKIDFRVDFAAMVPMQIQTIIAENPGKLNLIRNLLIGGASVSPQLEAQLAPFETNAFESFGMTETMSHIAVKKLNKASFLEEGPERMAPFQALKGIRFSTEDEKLIIHAPGLGLPRLETTDVVELVGENAFYWKGRADFAINSGGIKFHPELIEKKLAGIIDTRFFITGEKDPLLGEKMVLVLEGSENDFHPQAILKAIKPKLSRYEVPKKIYFVAAFPETASGKVNRLQTRKMLNL